jgi:hypothetical protein
LAALGVPDSWPLLAENVAQAGLLAIANVRVRERVSWALGVKE